MCQQEKLRDRSRRAEWNCGLVARATSEYVKHKFKSVNATIIQLLGHTCCEGGITTPPPPAVLCPEINGLELRSLSAIFPCEEALASTDCLLLLFSLLKMRLSAFNLSLIRILLCCNENNSRSAISSSASFQDGQK